MNQSKQAPRRRMTRREWRDPALPASGTELGRVLAACGAAVALMTSGILWLLPKAHALIAGPEDFVARNYDGTEYQLNLADARLVLVNGNLPLDAEPAPALAVADDATGQQLEAEAAEQYRAMAAAAAADGITLELVTGYQDVSAREAAFDARKQVYLEKGLSEEEAAAYAASVCPPANASEQATGYAADILSPDCTEKTTRFADTRAYEWLTAYAAEYGFVLRWPEERQAATGMVYEPWHWRYVGAEKCPRHPRVRTLAGGVPCAGAHKAVTKKENDC